MKSWYWIASILVVLAMTGATLWLYPGLPDRIPTHWNLRGEIDGYGSKSTVFLLPAIMAVLLVFFRALPWLSPKQFEVETFEPTYLFIVLSVTCLFAYLHAMMLWVVVNPPLRMDRALFGGICFFFMLLGNVMGKVRRNFWIGIRTPWTLADERVWDATHRLGGRVMVGGGLLALAASMIGPPVSGLFVLGASALVPVVYSLILYKRLNPG